MLARLRWLAVSVLVAVSASLIAGLVNRDSTHRCTVDPSACRNDSDYIETRGFPSSGWLITEPLPRGRDAWEAVVEATLHRFRPILLTAAVAILGMVPIAPTIFWGPMAYAIMGGLAVATVLTLVFLPALYVIWFRIDVPERHASEAACPSILLPS